MTNPLIETSQARRDEWARVNSLLPWDESPEWARFAFRDGSAWKWLEKPPTKPGRACVIRRLPRIETAEHLFRRPGKRNEPSGTMRLLMAHAPARLAAKAGVTDDPEREALLLYARVLEKTRAKYREEFDALLDEVLNDGH